MPYRTPCPHGKSQRQNCFVCSPQNFCFHVTSAKRGYKSACSVCSPQNFCFHVNPEKLGHKNVCLICSPQSFCFHTDQEKPRRKIICSICSPQNFCLCVNPDKLGYKSECPKCTPGIHWARAASFTKRGLRGLVKGLGLTDSPRLPKMRSDVSVWKDLLLGPEIPNDRLETCTEGHGWPDFKDEALEEKGPKPNGLKMSQWARAVLEYRAARPYRVAWRWDSTKRTIFDDVFAFYGWQLDQKQKEYL